MDSKKRQQVYERDKATCQVCGRKLNWNIYECGHIVDRVVGGSDELTNLAAMCLICNRLKPIHRTKEEFAEWCKSDIDKMLTNPMRRGVKMVFRDLAENGCVPTGFPPVGLRAKEVVFESSGITRQGRKWEPDPKTWPLVQQAWQMRLAGHTLSEIHAEIPFFEKPESWSRFFCNKAYLHTGVCTPEEWDTVQKMRRLSREGGAYPRRKRSPYLLSSPNFKCLCAYCSSPISGSKTIYTLKDGTRKDWPYYICSRKKRDWSSCERGKALKAEVVERAVLNTILNQTPMLDPIAIAEMRHIIRSEDVRRAKQILGRLIDKIVLSRDGGELYYRQNSLPIAKAAFEYT